MIKSELIQKIAEENPHLFQRDVERIVGTVFEEIIEAMAAGHRVELRGFGAFSVKRREARQGRNPRTGDSVTVEEKFVPFFKTGKELRERLNGKTPEAPSARRRGKAATATKSATNKPVNGIEKPAAAKPSKADATKADEAVPALSAQAKPGTL